SLATISLCFDQNRTAATSRVIGRMFHDFITRNHVVAVDDVRGNTVTRSFLSQVFYCGLHTGRRRVGVAVVLGDDNQRQSLHGGEIESFMESARAHTAIAD